MERHEILEATGELKRTHTTRAALFSRGREDVWVYDYAWRGSGGLMIDGLGGLALARPLPGEQLVQTRGGEISDTGEDIAEPRLRIDVVEAAGRDHRQHDGGQIGAALRAGEGPISALMHTSP